MILQNIPSKFEKLLSIPDKISHIALLGNITGSPDFLNFLNTASSNITMVRGEFDKPTIVNSRTPESNNNHEALQETAIPLVAVIKEGNFKIGCCNGYTVVPKSDPLSLLSLARQLDVDIMLWGGTHNVEAYTLEEKFFVNPGSCTGAFNSDWPIINESITNTNENDNVDTDARIQQNDDKLKSMSIDDDNNKTKSEDDKKTENTKIEENNEENTKVDNNKDDTDSINEEDISISEIEISGSNVPSFCLLDIQGSTCILYIYMFIDGEVKVDKVKYEKPNEDD